MTPIGEERLVAFVRTSRTRVRRLKFHQDVYDGFSEMKVVTQISSAGQHSVDAEEVSLLQSSANVASLEVDGNYLERPKTPSWAWLLLVAAVGSRPSLAPDCQTRMQVPLHLSQPCPRVASRFAPSPRRALYLCCWRTFRR